MKNLKRQDRNGTRTTSDIERKYKLGQIDYTAEEIERLKMEITVDSSLSTSSIRPVANNVITRELNNKVNKEVGKGLSSNDFTDELLNKLTRISGEVTAPSNGFFTLTVDADGNLWAHCTEEGTIPNFEYEEETGNLYFVTEVE